MQNITTETLHLFNRPERHPLVGGNLFTKRTQWIRVNFQSHGTIYIGDSLLYKGQGKEIQLREDAYCKVLGNEAPQLLYYCETLKEYRHLNTRTFVENEEFAIIYTHKGHSVEKRLEVYKALLERMSIVLPHYQSKVCREKSNEMIDMKLLRKRLGQIEELLPQLKDLLEEGTEVYKEYGGNDWLLTVNLRAT